jgi:hypothetical protein
MKYSAKRLGATFEIGRRVSREWAIPSIRSARYDNERKTHVQQEEEEELMTTEEAETMLDQDLAEHIEASEVLETEALPNVMGLHPTEFAAPSATRSHCDRRRQPREILIQRVLWEFVHEQGAEEATPS